MEILKFFIKNNLPNSELDLTPLTDTFRKESIIDSDDEVIYFIPSKNFMTNRLIFTSKKLIVKNRGDWGDDLEFKYEEFINFRVIQRKLLFIKMDLSVTPDYDRSKFHHTQLSLEFFVQKKHAEAFTSLFCNILTLKYPQFFNTETNWKKVLLREVIFRKEV